MVQKRRTRADDYTTDESEAPYLPHLAVREGRHDTYQSTGLLSASGRPIVRHYLASNPIGFLADLDEDADGESYYYQELPHTIEDDVQDG